MAKKAPKSTWKRPEKPVKDFSDTELGELIRHSFLEFSGTLDRWESAVGMTFLAKYMGWKIAHLVHSRATVKQYEKIMGIDIKKDFDPTTDQSRRSYAWDAVQHLSSFWKAVKGESGIEGARNPNIAAEPLGDS